jgi:uncharacterized iron-regulated membrane protein
MNDDSPTAANRAWPDYRAVWRWHFYAGLFCIPFVIVLSISGSIYLFKPQIEAWNEREFDHLQLTGRPASVADQVRAALAALPDSSLSAYELPASDQAAGRVLLRQNGEAIRVYVHPETLAVLHTFPDDQRLTRWLFRLHGELLIGDWGSRLVELAASWTIVMILTGLYLWWPRQAKGLGGIVYPRLLSGSRIFWRDLHSVVGVWVSALALFLLVSGLPWAKLWGDYLKVARRVTGTASARQDWTNSSERRTSAGSGGSSEHGGHGHGGGSRRREDAPLPKDLSAFDRIAATVRPLQLSPPVQISPPARGAEHWAVKSMTANRPQRVSLVVDGETGAIISREGFSDRKLIDRFVAIGIAAHEGQLFGWPNQLLGLLTAAGLLTLCGSGVVLWWRRRESGVLGAPQAQFNPRVSFGLILLVVLLGIYLPLFGASLVLVLLIERLILCRIPPVRDWLGLRPARGRVAVQAALLLLAVGLCGCGPSPVAGGTKGTLRAGGDLLSEVQITIHHREGVAWQPLGFAVTASDGTFELVTNRAEGPLRLAPGEYRCTLESVGAPVRVPKEYSQPETTPLIVQRSAGDTVLELVIPARLLPLGSH